MLHYCSALYNFSLIKAEAEKPTEGPRLRRHRWETNAPFLIYATDGAQVHGISPNGLDRCLYGLCFTLQLAGSSHLGRDRWFSLFSDCLLWPTISQALTPSTHHRKSTLHQMKELKGKEVSGK
ncbi:unnamed protein product [Leuciscus chuanchicus]